MSGHPKNKGVMMTSSKDAMYIWDDNSPKSIFLEKYFPRKTPTQYSSFTSFIFNCLCKNNKSLKGSFKICIINLFTVEQMAVYMRHSKYLADKNEVGGIECIRLSSTENSRDEVYFTRIRENFPCDFQDPFFKQWDQIVRLLGVF